jgi:hypothetical protein
MVTSGWLIGDSETAGVETRVEPDAEGGLEV